MSMSIMVTRAELSRSDKRGNKAARLAPSTNVCAKKEGENERYQCIEINERNGKHDTDSDILLKNKEGV